MLVKFIVNYFKVLGQSSNQVAFAKGVYQIMLKHHLGLIQSEQKKFLKAKAEIEATGKTKIDWDENVSDQDYVWSIDVMADEIESNRPRSLEAYKYLWDRPSVVEAYNYLWAKRFVERLKLPSGQLSQCYYIPIQKVLGHDSKSR